MGRSSFQRVYVARFCARCGKEEFEGHVFGKWRTRHLRAESGTREIYCDQCKEPPKLFNIQMSEWALVPTLPEGVTE